MKTVIIILIFILIGCSSVNQQANTIRIKGSDTMLILTKSLAREYMLQNKDISIYVEGGGTTSGVNALINQEIEIATASRSLKPDEAKVLAEYYGSVGMYYLVAKDALSIYLNKENDVKNLSIQELKKIFTGEIKNWKELGGNDKEIIPIIRTPNSGTHFYFKEHVLEGTDYNNKSHVVPTTTTVIEFVKENENAIGYGGIGYAEGVNHASIDGVEATELNARNDTYPITRYLHFFTSRTPAGAVKDFIDWVLTPEGQAIIKQSGFIPLWEVSD
jgi:phosphate transport system substrate-binding protein